ncbi:MAG: acyltransferase [Pseudomonadota bacterium]
MTPTKKIIHKDALVESKTIGRGTRIWRNAHVLPGAVIGEECNIGENCYVEGHVKIGNGVTVKNNVALWDNIIIEDDVFIGPAAAFTNDLRPRAHNKKTYKELEGIFVKKGATIGAHATVVCGITIHEHAFIGAGAVVTRDVPAYHVVYGNPARFKGFVCRCSNPIPSDTLLYHCPCGLTYKIKGQKVTNV